MQQQPNETVQLFFNGNNDKMVTNNENKDNVYKDYILTQNTNLLKTNKKLTIENLELIKKNEEIEDEMDVTEKRLGNTKNYLKNFRFINENVNKLIKEYNKFGNNLKIGDILENLNVILVSFFLIMIVCYFFLVSWVLFFTFIILHLTFIYIVQEKFVPLLKTIENRRKRVLDIENQIRKENASMEKTMDIISVFIDNAL